MASIAPYVVPLILGVLFASYTSKIAGRKGRNPVTWGVLGFFVDRRHDGRSEEGVALAEVHPDDTRGGPSHGAQRSIRRRETQ